MCIMVWTRPTSTGSWSLLALEAVKRFQSRPHRCVHGGPDGAWVKVLAVGFL